MTRRLLAYACVVLCVGAMRIPTLEEIRAERARREAGVAKVQTQAIWAPLPGPQTLAYTSLADELFYGGAPGGGKSDLALGLALTAHTKSIIFRREFSMFRGPDGLIERSRQIIGDEGRLNEGLYIWRDLPGGRSLEFGAVKNEADKLKWKGRPHDLKVFDELPDFLESQYRFLIAWLRTTIDGQRTRVVSTGNPPTTPEGQWVIQYWGPWLDPHHPRPAKPGELRWFVTLDGKDVEVDGPHAVDHRGEKIRPRSRTFIPAALEDNPLLARTGYADILDNLPEPLRSQLRRGDFAAAQPDDPWQVIPTAWVRAAQERWRQRPSPIGTVPCGGAGVDPSRGGADEFVIAKRYDNWIAPLIVHPGKAAADGEKGAALVVSALGVDKAVPIGIDVGGAAGSSVFDQATMLHLMAVALNGSRKSDARDRSGKLGFVNKRAEWHWGLRELLDPTSGQDLALPPDTQLLSDLCAPRWKFTPRGIQVELKEETKKRIGRSPDRGEAVIYACAKDVLGVIPPGALDIGADSHTDIGMDREL
jgi:hypothetical protein